jgi:hypothetical protein
MIIYLSDTELDLKLNKQIEELWSEIRRFFILYG